MWSPQILAFRLYLNLSNSYYNTNLKYFFEREMERENIKRERERESDRGPNILFGADSMAYLIRHLHFQVHVDTPDHCTAIHAFINI